MTRRRQPVTPLLSRLGRVIEVEDFSSFYRTDIAEMIGVDPSCISRAAKSLRIDKYDKIPREDIWLLYIFFAWKRKHPYNWAKSYHKELEDLGEEMGKEKGDEYFLNKYVYSQGGSRQDCEDMIEDWIARQSSISMKIA